jgi:hypothetical protein
MSSYLRPSTHRRTSSNTRSAGLRRVGRPPLSHRLPLVKNRMFPYHVLHPCPLPRPEHPLSRLAADPPPLSPASIAPLAAAPTAPAISWLSEPLPPACKAGKTLLPGALKLSSMAVPYLLSFGWGENTSHRKWYKSAILLCVLYIFVQRCANFSHASITNRRVRYSPY